MIKKFSMEKCKPIATPIGHGIQLSKDDGASKVDKNSYKSMVGSLMFFTNIRPDIQYVISLVSRFIADPFELHLQATKRII